MKLKKKDHKVFRARVANTLQFIAKRRKTESRLKGTPESIVILARECYGDSIMLTPLIGSLRKEYPDASIYIIAFSQIIFNFFSADPNVTAVYHAKRNMKRYRKEILSKEFDLLFNPKDHPSTHFLIQSVLIRARHKVSHFNPDHEGLFDHLISLEPHTHESVKNLSLMSAIGSKVTPQSCKPYLPPMPVSADIASLLQKLQPGKYIGINISAGHSGGHRTIQQWSELIREFPDEMFIILSAPQDLAKKRELELPHSNVLPSPSTGNIFEVGEIVKQLKLLITPDTALVHIAACSDTPLIALYRNYLADRTQFGPLSTIQEIIVSPTPDIINIESPAVTASLRQMLKILP
ncbi:MAG: glycosyltransferase family 9 protein [Chlorobium sp.]|nr:MAG: glycosyltransferase family 9 protein [Chlorobium sp.]